MTNAFKVPTTAAKMALCVIILRDRLIALVNLDLPEMDTAAQVRILFWQKKVLRKEVAGYNKSRLDLTENGCHVELGSIEKG